MAASDSALFLGNLRPDVRVGALKQNIIHMFHQLGATVNKTAIQVNSKPHSVYAFVHLASEEERDIILDLLNSANILRDLNLTEIVRDGKIFKVAPKLERWQLASSGGGSGGGGGSSSGQNQFLGLPTQHSLKNSQGNSSQWSNNSPVESAIFSQDASEKISTHKQNGFADIQKEASVSSTGDPRKTYTKVATRKPEEHYYVKRESTVPMFQSLLKNKTHYGGGLSDTEAEKGKTVISGGEKGDDELDSDEDIVMPNSNKKSKKKSNLKKKKHSFRISVERDKTAVDLSVIKKANDNALKGGSGMKGVAEFFHKDLYVLNETLGNENRGLEFKRGQGEYIHRQFQDHVSIYMSAFLNTEGGTLLVGVNDEGEVKGVDIDRQLEDQLRRDTDATIKRIRPNVFPNMYQLDFVQVVDSHDQPLGDRRVIELSITPGTSGQLYQTQTGDVYVRRDGSIQGPLQAADIQEWTRMMLYEEQRRKDKEISNLQEKEKQLLAELEERRANEERLAARLSAIHPNGKKIKDKDDKSKVCVIL